MRILFTTLPESGHFHPLVPIARAAAEARHEVAFACPASFTAYVERAGFRAFPAGFDLRGHRREELFGGVPQQADADRAFWMVPHLWIGVFSAVMAPDLLALARAWPPDLIVRETHEYGGCIAAEVLGIPHASVRTSPTSPATLREIGGAALALLRERHGLPPEPDVAMPYRYLHLACQPPRFAPLGEIAAPTAHLLRPTNAEAQDEPPPPWVADLPDVPTIYATLGTIVSRWPAGRALFPVILDALRDEPINLIVTVGRDNDPAAFGVQPSNVHIERYIPQGTLLPRCDLVVQQAGFSTITGALNAGLPMVLLPVNADQLSDAASCAALGVGKVVGPAERTPEAIRSVVREVLGDSSYRENARQVRDEMAQLPGPEYAVALLERLAAEKRPILAGA